LKMWLKKGQDDGRGGGYRQYARWSTRLERTEEKMVKDVGMDRTEDG
jgi:hypothetical protein